MTEYGKHMMMRFILALLRKFQRLNQVQWIEETNRRNSEPKKKIPMKKSHHGVNSLQDRRSSE